MSCHKRYSFLLLCLSVFTSLPGQEFNLGAPPINQFSKRTYKGGTQNWDIVQDSRGVMYFANNDGLLEYDGSNWRLHPVDNGTIVRSLALAADGKIYAGGQGDFGYFFPDEKGVLNYHSLRSLVPPSNRNFEDVWDIVIHDQDILFRTNNQLFLLRNGNITVLVQQTPLQFLGEAGGAIYLQDLNSRLLVLDGDSLRKVDIQWPYEDVLISGMLDYHPDTILLTTLKHGILSLQNGEITGWETPASDLLRENRIYCAALLPGKMLALGTSLSGLVILDAHRRILQLLNKDQGLQNNTVLSLFRDRSKNLWLGLDNGIDYIQIHSAFYSIFPDRDLGGTGYAVEIQDGNIYFGTNTGIFTTSWKPYYTPEEKKNFRLVQNTDGQAWSLNVLDNSLLAGHHEGAYLIENGSAERITDLQGIWKFIPLSTSQALAGHYNGLAFFNKVRDRWTFSSRTEHFKESSRILVKGSGNRVWMAHPYRGIFEIRFPEPDSARVTQFGESDGLPSDLNNHVFRLGSQTVFTGETGVFTFRQDTRRFEPHPGFTQIFGTETRVKYLKQDLYGNIWYVAGNEVGCLLVNEDPIEKTIRRIPVPELSGRLVGGFEFIYPVDSNHIFIATDQGFLHFDLSRYLSTSDSIQLVLQEVRLGDGSDSLLYGGHLAPESTLPSPLLNSEQRALRFVFSATEYREKEFVQYAHYLEGADQDWSDWSRENNLSLSNLSPGFYTLHIKARNARGKVSDVRSFSFTISPPWYASRIALIAYGLLFIGLIISIIYFQQSRFEREKQQMKDTHQQREEAHQEKVRQSEEAINRLRNEKLEAEVQYKNQELATATMHLVQKSDMLNTIKEALEKLKKNANGHLETKKEISRIIKMVERDASLDEDWEQFSRNFDQVHSDFLKNIAQAYPDLNPNDLKLCAYLRMNLTSKEIASLMNISVRGVETSRYRLRKKLDLDTQVNLTEFLMKQ